MYVSLVHIPLTLLYNFCKATFKLNIAFYVYTKDIGELSFLFEVNCLLRIDRNVSLFGTLVLFFSVVILLLVTEVNACTDRGYVTCF